MAVNIGMLGCGDIAEVHGEAIQPIKEKIRFSACCDTVKEKAEAWAKSYGADRVYGSLEEMLRSESLDGIQLATWPNQHREQIETCLKAGVKNILCEKALTQTGREAVEIWDMVQDAGAFLMEGFMYRHHPAIRKMERLVSNGEIGEVDYARAAFNHFFPDELPEIQGELNWRLRPECGGGVPYDFTCYAVNACGHFARRIPKRIFASGTVNKKFGVINRLLGVVEYEDDKVGLIESTTRSESSQSLMVSGSHGILKLPVSWTIGGDIILEREFSVAFANMRSDKFLIPEANPYTLQLENFADVIEGEAKPVVPLAQSVVNTHVIEGLVNSAMERELVELSIPDRICDVYRTTLDGQ